jgi:hypothetical protein
LRGAVQRVRQALAGEFGSSPEATAVRAWEISSLNTYMSQLSLMARTEVLDCPADIHLQGRLNALARAGASGATARVLVSGVRMVERLGFFPTTVSPLHWLMVRAMEKKGKDGRRPQLWATGEQLESLQLYQAHWAWSKLVFLATCSVVYIWRISDAASVTWAGISVPGHITFYDLKVNKAWATYELSPFMEHWRRAIWATRRPDHQLQALLIPGGVATLRSLWPRIFGATKAAGLPWHALRRAGAAAFLRMGGNLSSLQIWGRWHSNYQPRRYAACPSDWQWPSHLNLFEPRATNQGQFRHMQSVTLEARTLWPPAAFAVARRPSVLRVECQPTAEPLEQADSCSEREGAAVGAMPATGSGSTIPAQEHPATPEQRTFNQGTYREVGDEGSTNPSKRETSPTEPTDRPSKKARTSGSRFSLPTTEDQDAHFGYEVSAARKGNHFPLWRPLPLPGAFAAGGSGRTHPEGCTPLGATPQDEARSPGRLTGRSGSADVESLAWSGPPDTGVVLLTGGHAGALGKRRCFRRRRKPRGH